MNEFRLTEDRRLDEYTVTSKCWPLRVMRMQMIWIIISDQAICGLVDTGW